VIEVLVADDQTLVRQGIESLLALSTDIRVVAHAADGHEVLRAVEELDADVILLDLRMPGMDGIETLRRLRAEGNDLPVLVLTTFDDDELVIRSLRAGAQGFMLKDTTLEWLTEAVRTVADGGTIALPALTERTLRALEQTHPPDDFAELPEPQELTDREVDVLRLLAGGHTNRDIAEALFLAEGTVKNHLSSIMLKLGVADRTRAVLRALHLGLLGPRQHDGPTPLGGPLPDLLMRKRRVVARIRGGLLYRRGVRVTE